MLIHRSIEMCTLSDFSDHPSLQAPFAMLFLFDTDKTPKNEQYIKAIHTFDPGLDSIPELCKDPLGKPYLKDSPLHISFTDCENLRIVGISALSIGIDLEKVRSIRWERILKRFIHPDETAAIHNDKDFFSLWTAKESYVKYTGKGITDGYGSFSVYSLPEHIMTSEMEPDWFLSVCTPHECCIKLMDMR